MFEVPCPECGADVEFFKDESTGRCGACGHRFRNPGMDFGCAQWCALAEECLGIVPERAEGPAKKEGALAGRLIQEVREAFHDDATRLTHALRVYHLAKEFVRREGANPRMTLAAALLLEVARSWASPSKDLAESGCQKVRTILGQIGVEEATAAGVCQVIADGPDTPQPTVESQVVWDADRLAQWIADDRIGLKGLTDGEITAQLATEAARQRARQLKDAASNAPAGDAEPG